MPSKPRCLPCFPQPVPARCLLLEHPAGPCQGRCRHHGCLGSLSVLPRPHPHRGGIGMAFGTVGSPRVGLISLDKKDKFMYLSHPAISQVTVPPSRLDLGPPGATDPTAMGKLGQDGGVGWSFDPARGILMVSMPSIPLFMATSALNPYRGTWGEPQIHEPLGRRWAARWEGSLLPFVPTTCIPAPCPFPGNSSALGCGENQRGPTWAQRPA